MRHVIAMLVGELLAVLAHGHAPHAASDLRLAALDPHAIGPSTGSLGFAQGYSCHRTVRLDVASPRGGSLGPRDPFGGEPGVGNRRSVRRSGGDYLLRLKAGARHTGRRATG